MLTYPVTKTKMATVHLMALPFALTMTMTIQVGGYGHHHFQQPSACKDEGNDHGSGLQAVGHL